MPLAGGRSIRHCRASNSLCWSRRIKRPCVQRSREAPRDYGDRTDVSFETVRWHAKRVMQKMDCAKQQDVMYTLLYRNALFSVLD